MFRLLATVCLCFSLSTVSLSSFAAGKAPETSAHGPKKQLSTIVFAGLAGAILGLSTLSFYGRPQDKLDNIAVGAAIGIIGGALYSTFKAATEPHDFYNLRQPAGSEILALQERARSPGSSQATPRLGFKFSF